jgi:hypothetical protein
MSQVTPISVIEQNAVQYSSQAQRPTDLRPNSMAPPILRGMVQQAPQGAPTTPLYTLPPSQQAPMYMAPLQSAAPESGGGDVTPAPPPPPQPVAPTKPAEEGTSEIGEKKNPVVVIGGREYDRDSIIVIGLVIFIWVLVWLTSGLYNVLRYDTLFIIIFAVFIIYMFMTIFTSDTTSGGVVYELNILLTVEQMISILFGTVALFTLFSKNLNANIHENCHAILFRLCVSILIILSMASLWINVITSGRMFRAIRKLKQGCYNIALTLFIIVGLIYYKGTSCAKDVL